MDGNENKKNENAFSKSLDIEEYKRLTGLINEIEKRNVSIASWTVAISVGIFSFTIKELFLNGSNICPLQFGVFLPLTPFLLIIPAFLLIIAHRNELCRVAAYLNIFYEKKLKRLGWEGGVILFRSRLKQKEKRCCFIKIFQKLFNYEEAHSQIPLIFCGLAVISVTIFYDGISKINPKWYHYAIPIILSGLLIYLCCLFDTVLSKKYIYYRRIWKEIKNKSNLK